jgi:hypothetical protein
MNVSLMLEAPASKAEPELMDAGEFRAAMARLELKIKDFPHGSESIVKLRRGYTNISYELMIEIGARLGIRPRVTWEKIPEEKS